MSDEEIFAAARQLDGAEARSAYLHTACGGDREQRQRIEALLAADEQCDSLLDVPFMETSTEKFVTSNVMPGDSIGPYKLLQRIGEGGFGVVFMAEQRKPINRRVALKIIKPGMDSRLVIARFEAERQALAMMDHPNIAKIYDAGVTDFGQPYFVMELVKGLPITQFCDEQKLQVSGRLKILLPVCRAIQHAHQKGIIHRDIKPSNVLVSLYDGTPTPKVIDFGVAKAIECPLTEKTIFTQIGQILGTPEYMSPEQAEMNQLDIDTRSDVYALGCLLYELLTGSTPLDRERLRSAAFDRMLRMLREEEPPRPSVRLSSSVNAAAVSAQRAIDPKRLSQLVRGDLDWVTMHALEKDRSRRYATANELAADIERYLNHEPVHAGPPTAAYRLRKFARKYQAALATAGLFIGLLVLASVFSTWQALRATRAEAVAEERRKEAEKAEGQAINDRDEKERQRVRAVEAERAARAERQRAELNAAQARRNLYTAHMQQIQLEWDRSDIARVRELLAKYSSPAAEKDDLRGWEWGYWTRMCEQELRTLKGHEGPVNAVAFNSDGSLVASAGQDGKLCVWNVGDGKLVREIKAHERGATCVAFHANIIATGGVDKVLRLWNASGGHELARFQFGNVVSSVAFSNHGKLLAAGVTSQSGDTPRPGSSVERRIIDVASSEVLHRLHAERDVYDLAFTKDDSQLVIAAAPNLEFWDTRTGALLKEVAVDNVRDNNRRFERTSALALSRTNEFAVTVNEDHLVRVRRFGDAEPTTTYRGHTGALMTVALSPDDRVIASAGADNAVILRDIGTGDEIQRLRGHEKGVMCVRFSPDGLRLASASNDGTVKIWDAVQPTDFRPFLTETRGHHKAEAFSHDGSLYAVSHFWDTGSDHTFYQWVEVRDALSGRRAFQLVGHDGWIDAIAFSHDGTRVATGARDETVKVYDFATQRELYTLDGFRFGMGSLTFSPDDRWLEVLTFSFDAKTQTQILTEQVWNTSTEKRAASFPATGFAFHPQQQIFAVAAAEKDIYAIDFYRTGEQLDEQTPFRSWKLEEAAWGLRFDRSGKRLAANVGNNVVVWDVADGNKLTSIPDAGALLGFDKLGERLFTLSGARTLSAWRTETGDLMCDVTLPPDGEYMTVILSQDGMRIAGAIFASII